MQRDAKKSFKLFLSNTFYSANLTYVLTKLYFANDSLLNSILLR